MDRKATQAVNGAPSRGRTAWLGLVARLLLGLMFVVSGASKRSAPAEEFAVVIENYDLVSTDAAQSVSALLPWVELLVGFALIFGFLTPQASAAAGAMLLVFVLALLSTKARGLDLPNCGCFGGRFHPAPMTMAALDALMTGAAFLSLRHGAKRLSLDNWAR
jgi:uncharacterized membrane protein YphA (DoxX/SURF4 family)